VQWEFYCFQTAEQSSLKLAPASGNQAIGSDGFRRPIDFAKCPMRFIVAGDTFWEKSGRLPFSFLVRAMACHACQLTGLKTFAFLRKTIWITMYRKYFMWKKSYERNCKAMRI
jgi:hypothetical protein